jgi:hypothetical protein
MMMKLLVSVFIQYCLLLFFIALVLEKNRCVETIGWLSSITTYGVDINVCFCG